MLRFAYEPLFGHGLLHADPHPGNQLYEPDGRLTLLDFGCVRAFERPFVERFARLCDSVLRDDRGTFRILSIELGLAPRPERVDFEELWQQYEWLLMPVRDEHFVFSEKWWKRGREFSRPSSKNARHRGMPPEFLWLQRVQWGLWAVLRRIGGHADLAPTFRAALSLAL